MPTENDKRIARNTIYLYGRMLLTIFISLYTSRVVLDVLGVADYGIYSVVGGIAMIFGFINGAMSGATSRFLSYEIGAGGHLKLRQTFSAALSVHSIIGLIFLVLAETVGLWYVETKLVVAPGRLDAALWTYQFAVVGVLVQILQIPFMAFIIARERMGYYALVAFINVILKLGVVLLLLYVATADTLKIYAGLMFGVTVIVALMYLVYCRLNFAEARWGRRNDLRIIRSMVRFCSWNIYSNLCFTARFQGMQLIINKFGGAVLNAAGGLTITISATINGFATTVITAFRPQIVQQYAKSDFPYMNKLLVNCARFSLLLIGLLVVPIVIGMDSLLSIWLKEVPEYTAVFCRVALMAVCGELLNDIISIGIHATGKVVRLSLVSGTLYLVELPLMWLMLKIWGNPTLLYVTHLVMIFFISAVDSMILKSQVAQFSLRRFWLRGVVTPGAILGVTLVLTWYFTSGWTLDIAGLLGMGIISTLLLGIQTWLFAIDSEMRASFKRRLLKLFRRQ